MLRRKNYQTQTHLEPALRKSIALIPVLMFAVLSCGEATEPDDELQLTMQNLAGIYYGVTFTTEENGVTTDQLWRGATIELILYADGGTGGTLFIPAEDPGESDLNASLIGLWQLDGNTATLDHGSDTFLRGMELVFDQTHFTGVRTIGAVTYRVVLAM